MSMDRCVYCSGQVDTDEDLDCYQPDPRMSVAIKYPDICVCESCRQMENEQE